MQRDKITYSIEIEEEDLPVHQACGCGEPDCLRRHITPLRLRLAKGQLWAWCSVEVKASFGGVSASAYLGGCSYRNEADFTQEGGYYQEMCKEAADELEVKLRAAAAYFEEAA